MKSVMIGSLLLSLIAAAFYFLLGAHVITVPALNIKDAPPGIVYIAGGCYLLGGILILVRKRWLWIFGLVMNTLVIAFFFIMYINQPEIMFSLPGLGTKIPQILLEVGLIYLIITHRKQPINS
jgi:hypothetical protein